MKQHHLNYNFEYDFSDKYLYTTEYPIEYAANMLYGEHATVQSVYPMGSDRTYVVTEKKKDIYAEGLDKVYKFIVNGRFGCYDGNWVNLTEAKV